MNTHPAPATRAPARSRGHHGHRVSPETAEVLDNAVLDLATRHGVLLHDPIDVIEVLTALTTATEDHLPDLITDARERGRTRQDIADALRVSPQHARTRYNTRKDTRTTA